MTAQERTQLIDRTLHTVERLFPCALPATLFELAIAAIAREHGLVVTPEEIVRVLSRLAEAQP